MKLQPILEGLESQLPQWLTRQRWFSKSSEPPTSVKIIEHELMRDAWPKLIWTIIEVDGEATYQVPIGLREADHLGAVLLGHENADIGLLPARITDESVDMVAYDALIDWTLSRVLFDVVTDGQHQAKSVRSMGAEQSNTSLVFDNRYVLKLFRRLQPGANPDVEVTSKLTEIGFRSVAPVIAAWRKDPFDLAVAQPFLWDGTEGWNLSLASVRDFLGSDNSGGSATAGSPAVRIDVSDPASAGGDFGPEAHRLGEVTAELHVALAEGFGLREYEISGLIKSLSGSLDELDLELRPGLQKVIDELASLDHSRVGKSIRIHGDYHLGQTLRSVTGWYIFDFEGEPARSLDMRSRYLSPFQDIAGMLRSFQYAAATGLREQMETEQDELANQADAWEAHNRKAFLDGYTSVEGVEDLFPEDPSTRDLLLKAFELEKAIYEVNYEKAYRPSWIAIPASALKRLLDR